MKPISRHSRSAPLVISLLALLVALVASPVGQSVAGGLSTGSVKKIARKTADKEIKKKAKKLTVARANDADALGGVPASGYVRSGVFQVSLGPSSWFAIVPGDPIVRSINGASASVTTGIHAFTVAFPVPAAADGRKLRLTRLRYCYTVSSVVKLTSETLVAFRYTAGAGSPIGTPIDNLFDIQSPGCRVIAANVVLGPQDNVAFSIGITATSGGTAGLGAVTAQFEPTDTAVEPIS